MLFACSALFTTGAAAQTDSGPAEESSEVEEIVVTAVKQPGLELGRAPLSATVLTPADLEAARINGVADLQKIAPGLAISRLGQVGGLFLTVRGIASNPFVVNRAAVYVDDVPYRELNDLLLEDLERIEFLRGPQSTLYGLNPEAGAVVITSAAPPDRVEGVASLGLEGFRTGSAWSGRATVGGPLVGERVRGRLTLAGRTGDAFTRNLGASDGEEGTLREFAARGRLSADLTERLDADLTFGAEVLDAPGLYEQEYLPIDRDRYNELYADRFNGGRRVGRYELFHDAAKDTREEQLYASLRLRHRFEGAELVAVTAWRKERDEAVGTELDLTGLPLFRGADTDDERVLSQEVRLASTGSEGLRWLVGVNVIDERDRQVLATQNLAGGQTGFTSGAAQTREGRDYAVFGQATLPVLSGRVRLTAGARYEIARRETRQPAQRFELPGIGEFITPDIALEQTFRELLPKAAIDVDLAPGWIAYASAAKGWLPGGFNLAAVSPDVAGDLVRYDAETLWSYEAGIKGTALGGRLRASAAAFWIEADNWQEFGLALGPDGSVRSTVVVTSDNAVRSRGLEAEIAYAPNEALDLGLAASVVDAEYRRYRFGPGIDYAGNRPPFAPEFEIKARGEWRFADAWRLAGSVAVQGDTPLSVDNSIAQDTYALIDVSLRRDIGPATLTLYAENLLDTYYFAGLGFDNFAFGRDGVRYAPVGGPRVVGVELEVRW